MADFQRLPTRFRCLGVDVNHPADALPPGKFPRLRNFRSYIEGTLTPREGLIHVSSVPGAVHTLARLNDPTPFNGGVPAVRVAGEGAHLHLGLPTQDPLPQVDTGYSGDPLTCLAVQPAGTPQPYLYVVDRSRQRKLSVTGNVFPIGLTQPNVPPTVDLAQPAVSVLDDLEYPGALIPWVHAGYANPPSSVNRVYTTVTVILFDSGTTGNCLIALADFQQIGIGMLLSVGVIDVSVVQDVKIAVTTSTIAAILYDSGTTGLCTIQPSGGLGTGRLQGPSPLGAPYDPTSNPLANQPFTPGRAALQRNVQIAKANQAVAASNAVALGGSPPAIDSNAPSLVARQNAFPIDCLVELNQGGGNAEYVRILSVAIGPDGLQSFRCVTTVTHAAGENIVGIPAVRLYLDNTHIVGDIVQDNGLTNSLAPPVGTTRYAGGIKSGSPFFRDLSTIGAGVPSGGLGGVTGRTGWDGFDHTAEVTAAKALAIANGYDLTTPCGLAQVAIYTAESLQPSYLGVLEKFTGALVCAATAYGSIESDAVCYPDGEIFYIVDDPLGANTPKWAPGSTDNADRYLPVGTEPVPLPLPPQPTPVNGVSGRPTQPEDLFHVSIKVDKLQAVEEIRIYLDIDEETSNFTKNVYYIAFSSNDLIAAVQASDAAVVTPLVTQLQTVAVPRIDLTPVQQQLSLGNDQWIELTWRVKDMIAVGTDPARSLATVTGAEIIVQALTSFGSLNVSYDAFYLMGSFGPDVGDIGRPMVYTYRYRSKATGDVSNPAPPLRGSQPGISVGGVLPRRQRVFMQATPSTDPHADTIDWFRFGGTLTDWAYVGSQDNTDTNRYADTFNDGALVGGVSLEFDNFQPWPTTDLPRKGTCNTAGSAVQWVTGDAFDVRWAPGSQILINGFPYTLYASPDGTALLHLLENAGAQMGVPFELPSATLLGATFPAYWGPYQGFYFAVGDPTNPGQLNWTKGNQPDLTSDKNTLYITSPSTPLQNGFVWDGAPYVFSTEDLYRIIEDWQRPNMWQAPVTPCGRGLWTRWAFCAEPDGIAFLAKDGIYETAGGARAVSLTDADLYPLFPHDGVAGVAANGLEPPDMSNTTALRLHYADGYLYFDYAIAGGALRTLVLDKKAGRWFPDVYTPGVAMRLWEEGTGVHDQVIGCHDGQLAVYGGTSDFGVAIPYSVRVPDVDGGDPRREKVFGDFIVKVDPQNTAGITVQPGYNDFTQTLASSIIGAGLTGEQTIIVDVLAGLGLLAKNLGLDISGSDVVAPVFYLWEPALIPKVERTARRATDWDDAGYFGAKFIQGVVLEFDTGGGSKTIQVQYDGGILGATLTLDDSTQNQGAFSFPVPFIGHLVRLLPSDPTGWLYYRARWIWEPSPELVAQWITQPTTKDFPGYSQDERILVPHMSTVDFDLAVTFDGTTQTYRVANSAGAFVKTEVLLRPNKGKVYSYAVRTVDGTAGVRIFQKDLEVRSKAWSMPGPYQPLKLFGDLSREAGARI